MNNKVTATIRLTGEEVNGESISCTGIQLIQLLESVQKLLPDYNWYAADISANHALSMNVPGQGEYPSFVGKTKQLKSMAKCIDQFLSGILLSVPKYIDRPNWSCPFQTESLPTNDLGDAILEIRMFDTTCFEIYSSNPDIIDSLRNHFQAKQSRWINSKCPSFIAKILTCFQTRGF